ncbi:MAG: hypothetical protein GX330_03800 [Bacteroidales bacterium]|nr:hypothetical protein [Bacteroidales bacterium]
MKKLSILLGVATFLFVACSNPQETTTQDENQAKHECQKKEKRHECCKEMTVEQKERCDAWKDWENQTPEKKAELITSKKEYIEGKLAKMEAKEAERKAKKDEFKEKWANFDNLDIEAQKNLIDEFKATCCKSKCGHKHKKCQDK